jgi:Domain of unknown function (DUF4214)
MLNSRHFVFQITAIALLCLAGVNAQAQSRSCVIDETNGVLRCGRLADEYGRLIPDRPTQVIVAPQPVPAPVIINRPGQRLDDGYDPRMSYEERQAAEQNRMEMQERVNGIFLDVLGRDADIVTLRRVTRQVTEGRAMADVRIELATSSEARAAINQIYRDILRREADPSGLNSQVAALRSGLTLAQIRQAIAESPEGRNRR